MDKFRDHLWRQLSFLCASSASYDNGFEDEAIRIAVVIRVLIHQTRNSTSLLTHLNATNIHLLSTCPKMPLDGTTMMIGLGAVQNGKYFAHLDNASIRRMISVKEWWNEVVYVLGEGTHLTRKDIVLGAANKDGGAHVDLQLDPKYEKLISFFQVREIRGDEVINWKDANAHYISLRQMAFELLRSPELFLQANFIKDESNFLSTTIELYQYKSLLTKRVRDLYNSYNLLREDHPIILKDVENLPYLPDDIVSEYIYSSSSNDEIRFSPSKTVEFSLAQELVKGIYFRSARPIVMPVLPNGQDKDASFISLKIGHILRANNVMQRLRNAGFESDVENYINLLVNNIISWPNTEIKNRDLLNAAINITEAFLLSEENREKVVEATKNSQRDALKFAGELERIYRKYDQDKIHDVRKCIIEMITFLNQEISDDIGVHFQLEQRILISPIFAPDALNQAAQRHIEIVDYFTNYGEKSYYVIGLVSNVDGVLFGRMLFDTETYKIQATKKSELLSKLKDLSLEDFLSAQGIEYIVG